MSRFRTLFLICIALLLLPFGIGCTQPPKIAAAPAQALSEGDAKITLAEAAAKARSSNADQLWTEASNYYAEVARQFPTQPEGMKAAEKTAEIQSVQLKNDYNGWIALRNASRQNVNSTLPEKTTLDQKRRALEIKMDKENSTSPFYKAFDLIVRVFGNNPKVSPGIALLVLSSFVALLLWPMQKKMYLSSKEMLKYQPDIKAIQDKYKDEPLLASQKVQQFYKEKGVNNPLSGCIMIIPQTIVTLIMFQLVSKYQFHFVGAEFLWINEAVGKIGLSWPAPLTGLIAHDLSEMDLPMLAVYALSQLALSKMMPPATDPQQAEIQKMVGTFFPIMYFMIMLQNQLPSALALYYFVSTLLGMIRQWMMIRQYGKAEAGGDASGPTLVAPSTVTDSGEKKLSANSKLISPKNRKK
jgi:YidC/Oxa1 family membrane protein insertase